MSIYFVPLMQSDDGKSMLPAPPGRKIDPAVFPLDPGKFNLLEMREDGLVLAPSSLVSTVKPNALEIAPDSALRVSLGLELDKMTSVLSLVNSEGMVVSSVTLPAQAGLPVSAEILFDFTPPPQDQDGVLTPLPTGTYLHLQFKLSDGSRKDLYMNVEQLVDVYQAGFATSVENGVISVVPGELLNPHEKVLFLQSGRLRTQLGLAYDAVNEALQIVGVGNNVVAEVNLPFSAGRPNDIEYVRDLELDGYPSADYLKFTYANPDGTEHVEYVAMGKLAQEPVPGAGIAIAIDKGANTIAVAYDAGHGLGVNRANELTIKPSEFVRENDKILFTKDGEICANLDVQIDGDVLRLTGQSGKLVAEAELPVGGVPTVAEVLYGFTPPPGHGEDKTPEEGSYLHLHYDIPKETDVYVNISDITGKSGQGIDIDKGVISVRLADKGALGFTSDKELAINREGLLSVQPENVLGVDSEGNLLLRLEDLVAPNSALYVNENGKLDIDEEKLTMKVSADPDNILKTGTDGRPYMPGDLGSIS